MKVLLPISEWSAEARARIKGVFTDIDDTLTIGGRVPAEAFRAMESLQEAGLLVIPVTGRPAGWCDMIARTWPVDAVVGENGAFAFRFDENVRYMRRLYVDTPEVRAEKKRCLAKIRDAVLDQVSGAAVSADQKYREADLAIDFAEDVTHLDNTSIKKIVDIFEFHGATARVSSIHVNGWLGEHSKLSMTKSMMLAFFDVDLDTVRDNYVFIGDSPNDEPMFDYFPWAVGVANFNDLRDQCRASPTWITKKSRASGFIEMAETLLESV